MAPGSSIGGGNWGRLAVNVDTMRGVVKNTVLSKLGVIGQQIIKKE